MNKNPLYLLSLFISAVFSLPSQKNQKIRTLSCADGPARFKATFDPGDFESGTNLYTVKDAHVYYNYSAAKLICEGNKPEELQCIGYWIVPGGKEIAEVRTSSSEGKIKAQFVTAKLYQGISVALSCAFP